MDFSHIAQELYLKNGPIESSSYKFQNVMDRHKKEAMTFMLLGLCPASLTHQNHFRFFDLTDRTVKER